MKKTIYTLGATMLLATTANAQVVINEVMQSNIDCIMDDINEFPDSWVELYNAGSEAVNLKDYKVSDSNKEADAYKLPNKTLAPKQYAIVYCDKEGTGMHTPFRLESGKNCKFYLFKDGEVIDNLPSGMKKQPAPNIAYGRKTDGGGEWGYQLKPTPEAENCGTIVDGILGEPVFSELGKVFPSSHTVTLELSLPEDCPEGTVIRYTTNGSEPTETSTKYENPITINNTKVVRAKLFCEGWLSPRSTTQSYIYHTRAVTLPVVSIVTNDSYFYDNKIGIYVNGTYQSGKKNYEFDWRRPINVEYFEGGEVESSLNQLCETRIQGGYTRGNKIKSLALYANKRFGEKRFSYEFFPEDRPGETNFKSLLLRNAGNDFDYLYMRDAIIQRSMVKNGVDFDWQAWQPSIVYINGKYIGIQNIRERSNDDNIFTHYNELEDIDMIENWGDLKAGTWDNYNAFKEFYSESGHTMEEYEKWMDCNEFIDLMVMNIFYCNLDFPGNNIVMWRPRTEDGRWRWIVKDTDFGMGLYGRSSNYNMISWLYNSNQDPGANKPQHTLLFRQLMEDEQFKKAFVDRMLIYMGDFMNKQRIIEIWDPMYELIKDEYPYHRAQINAWWPNYNDEMNSARNWLTNRCNNVINHMKQKWTLGASIPLKVNSNIDDNLAKAMVVKMNGIKLTRGHFDGKFYRKRTITFSAEPEDGLDGIYVQGWKLVVTDSEGTQETIINEKTFDFEVPSSGSVTVDVIFSDFDGIINIEADQNSSSAPVDAYYDAMGRKVSEGNKGMTIVRTKDGKVRKVMH